MIQDQPQKVESKGLGLGEVEAARDNVEKRAAYAEAMAEMLKGQAPELSAEHAKSAGLLRTLLADHAVQAKEIQDLSYRLNSAEFGDRELKATVEAQSLRIASLETHNRWLQGALVGIAVRVGAPGEIVNASQRGQALNDVRKMANDALDTPLSDILTTPERT